MYRNNLTQGSSAESPNKNYSSIAICCSLSTDLKSHDKRVHLCSVIYSALCAIVVFFFPCLIQVGWSSLRQGQVRPSHISSVVFLYSCSLHIFSPFTAAGLQNNYFFFFPPSHPWLRLVAPCCSRTTWLFFTRWMTWDQHLLFFWIVLDIFGCNSGRKEFLIF